jgi:hypothetical protein
MSKKDWKWITVLVIIYILLLFLFKREIFYFRFDPTLINRYFQSQDITYEIKDRRIFLSDADIYQATGLLYALGYDPSQFNFEHPPFLKTLFGISILFFNNPYIIQVIMGMLLIALTYYLGNRVYNNNLVAFLGGLLLVMDGLFLDISSQTLLDLGQTLLFIAYFLAIFYWRNLWLAGIFLGLFAGCKFWITPLFFIGLFAGYLWLKKQLHLKHFLLHLILGFVIYSLLYLPTFINHQGKFNIIFYWLKTLKYRLVHNTSSFPGASLLMFATGYFKTWWGKEQFIKSQPWSFFWPITLFFSFKKSLELIGKVNLTNLIGATPFLYLIYLGVQAPFPRYFLILLPFAYLNLAEVGIRWLFPHKHKVQF